MGLDMYLHRNVHLSTYADLAKAGEKEANLASYTKQYAQAQQVGAILGMPLSTEVSSFISIQWPVAYWRKSNQIHKWFVDTLAGGVDECQEIEVSRENLVDLLGLCVRVQGDHSLAGELLPTGGGFFFGDTTYDEYYFGDITRTVIMLKAAIDASHPEDYCSWTYQASW